MSSDRAPDPIPTRPSLRARIVRGLVSRAARLPSAWADWRSVKSFESVSPRNLKPLDPAQLGRIVAFYLPQFHPIPENDAWWGRGFTEWTNVASATPQFPGHKQPRVPADLGFYDLRLPEARVAQAELAKAFGIEAFCYWHYWFEGRRLLDRPFAEVARSGTPDFGICLAWANETWTRTWLGHGEVLIEQTYSADDDIAHARWLAEAFADERYLTVDGRPLFLVYRPNDHPAPERFIQALSHAAENRGLKPPFILGMNGWDPTVDARTLGFDGTVDFQPQLGDLPAGSRGPWWPSNAWRRARRGVSHATLRVYSHRQFYGRMLRRRLRLGFPTFPTLLVGWDNTPRRNERATVIVGSEPSLLRRAVADHLVMLAAEREEQERLLFVNAWNEWGEGNYLEPDDDQGLSRLEALRGGREDATERLIRPGQNQRRKR